MSRLKDTYQNEIVKGMIDKFGYKNIMEVPKLDKIVLNMGVGEAKDNAKVLEAAVKDMETITGQKAVITKAKNASMKDYKAATGLEAVVGYLYLTNQSDRMLSLIKKGLTFING